MVSSNSPEYQVVETIRDIAAEDWDACVSADQPFSKHAFLLALEESNCVNPKTGWLPQHIVIKDDNGKLIACCPQYLKGHSYGEYVFDWSWADAYERAGGRYYPKIQCAIPFTPVTGNRLLLHPDAGPEAQSRLLQAMIDHAGQSNVSSLHITFSTPQEAEFCQNQGMMMREGHQYHWNNDSYADFDDFLSRFSSRKRKNIRKERKAVTDSGIIMEVLSGEEIKDSHWDDFYRFYLDTSGRKWGHPYLNREFFSLLGQRQSDTVVLVLAHADNRIVAGALNLKGDKTLYGRYWGCLEDYRFLHFEACYYQAIEYAIQHNLQRVEAGAQGQHKIQRGYLPVKTYSAHWVADAGFERAIKDFLVHDKRVNDHEMAELGKYSPYKNM